MERQAQGNYHEQDRDKKHRADITAPAFKSSEYCEGCGIPKHRRESGNLFDHPDYNHKGQWIHSEGYRKKKAFLESKGEGDKQVMLKWSEYANGA